MIVLKKSGITENFDVMKIIKVLQKQTTLAKKWLVNQIL